MLFVEIRLSLDSDRVAPALKYIVQPERRTAELRPDPESRENRARLDDLELRLAELADLLSERDLVVRPGVAVGLVKKRRSGSENRRLACAFVEYLRYAAGHFVKCHAYNRILERTLIGSDLLVGRDCLAVREDPVNLVSERRNRR